MFQGTALCQQVKNKDMMAQNLGVPAFHQLLVVAVHVHTARQPIYDRRAVRL